MIETDCPFLAPEPHRGERNEPAYVKYIASKVAEIKGISFEKVAEITTKNAINFFNLK
jgi:TatD DNase family protein